MTEQTFYSREKTLAALQSIMYERDRQEQLKKEGKFEYTCADPVHSISNYRKATILGEEMGEVCNAVNEIDNCLHRSDGLGCDQARIALRNELIQVAAVAVAWVESLM